MQGHFVHGVLLAAVLVLASGCENGSSEPVRPPAAPPSRPPEKAQPRLPTLKLWLGAQEMTAEIARTPDEIQTGMMFRTSMPEDEGMLFVFAQPHRASFWMRNTVLPLSCAYIDSEGVILEIHDLHPLDETPVEASSDKVQYVLETNRGWFLRHNISTGAIIKTEHGTLRETFWQRR